MAVLLAGAVALTLRVGSADAQEYYPDTLVMGKITGATSGVVRVFSNTTVCATIGAGSVASDGTYQIVVNCPPGTGTVLVNGVATGATFRLIPGTVSSDVNGTIGGGPSSTPTTPNATAVATTGPGTPTAAAGTATTAAGTTTAAAGTPAGTADTPAAPRSDNTGSSSGSSHVWIFVIAGVFAVIALGAGGAAAVWMRRKRSPQNS